MRLLTASHVWILHSGHAETFAVRRDETGNETLRQTLGFVAAPGCLVGSGRPESSVQVEIKLSDDARLEAVPFATLLARPEWMQLFLVDFQVTLATLAQQSGRPPESVVLPASLPELEALQTRFRNCLNQGLASIERQETERRETRRRHGEQVLDQAARRLVGVLAPSVDEAVVFSSEDSLVAAIRETTRPLGITITPHPMASSFPTVEARIFSTARASRCRARKVALSPGWWQHDGGPILAFVDDDPVALVPRGRRYHVVDPSNRLRGEVDADTARAFGPDGYVFYRPFPDRPLDWRHLLAFTWKSIRSEIGWVILLAAFVGMLSLVIPSASRIIFDYIIPGGLRGHLWQIAAGMSCVAIVGAAFGLTQGFLLLRVETRGESELQSAILDRLLKLPSSFFRRFSVGDLATRTLSIDAIRAIIAGMGITTLLGSLSALFNFLIIFQHGLHLSLLAVGISLAAFLITLLAGLRSLRFARAVQDLEGELSGLVNQFISGVAKLRVTGTEAHAFAAWADRFAEKKRQRLHLLRIQTALGVFNVALPSVATLLIFLVAFGRLGDELSIGSFLAFTTAFGAFLTAAVALSQTGVQALAIVPLYERSLAILDTEPEVDAHRAWPGRLSGDIDLRHVSFRYGPDGPLVLNDVSLRIRPGEFIAIVGPSGSGKSTLLRLLLGFEQPETGAIFYNNQSLDTLDLTEVRRQIGCVLQRSRLLPGDIRTNIVGNSGAGTEQTWKALDLAGLADDIRAMPMGLHTVVTDGGGALSGGQRQRLMIARAVVNEPALLFFDEATSALDNETQAHIAGGLERLDVTRVVIAHRLSTIVNADRIYVMAGGRIVEQGTYASLMAQDGPFRQLATRQLA